MKSSGFLMLMLIVGFVLMTMSSCQENITGTTDVMNSSTEYLLPGSDDAQSYFIGKDKMDVILSDEMQVNPYRIILNSKSSSNFIKTIFSGSMPSGYHIYNFDIKIYINNVEITNAKDFDYCYIDQMYSVTYHRADVINNSFVRSLSGSTVNVVSQGSYTLINDDEQTINVNFTKFGTAIILGS